MKRATLLSALLGVGLAAAFALPGVGAGSAPVKLSATLNAAQEVPKPAGKLGGATGRFTATLDGRTLAWQLTFKGLTGKAAAAHVHLGRKGVAGGVAAPLCGPCASGAKGTVTLTAAAAQAVQASAAYVNIHTAKNPGGEIRGQIQGGAKTPSSPGSQSTTTSGTDTGGTGSDEYPYP